MRFDIGRRRDQRRLDVESHPQGDHVFFNQASKTNAGVEPFRNDVAKAVIDRDLDRDPRVVRQK